MEKNLTFCFFNNVAHDIRFTYLEAFSEHFGIDYFNTFITLPTFYNKNTTILDIVKLLNLNLLLPTENCSIICKHITTCSDKLASIKKYGMLNLSEVLIKNTPLRNFLLSYGIRIDPINEIFTYKGKDIKLTGFNDYCAECFLRSNLCNQNICDIHKEVAMIHNKLYYDKSEVEFFVCGSDIDLASYQSVQNSPEILWNVGKVINAINNEINEHFFVNAWAKQEGMKRYIIEFLLPLDALDMNCDHQYRNYYFDNEEWFAYAGFNYDDYIMGKIPLSFYRNRFLVETLFYKEYFAQAYYGQCIPYYQIKSNDIEIYKIEHIFNR